MIPWFSLFVEFHKDFLPIFVFMNGLAHFMKYLVFSFPLFFKPFVVKGCALLKNATTDYCNFGGCSCSITFPALANLFPKESHNGYYPLFEKNNNKEKKKEDMIT